MKFISLSYFDKAIIFLVPLLVLYLFNSKSIYVSVEYIYSIVLVAVPFLDFGLTGYFFYYYREHKSKRTAIIAIFNAFHILYAVLFTIGILFILVHYLWIPFEDYIVFIVFRCLFVVLFMFLSSYYRLVNKPQKALFVTIISNIISLITIFCFYILKLEVNVFIVFVGQILFCFYFFFKIIKRFVKKMNINKKVLYAILHKSFLFSWPTIIQAFLIMYIANYGKVNALHYLTLDEATLLSLTQRYAMLIQLTHTSIVAFLMKDLYLEEIKEINLKILLKYITLIILSAIVVFIVLSINWYFKAIDITSERIFQVSIAIIVYTVLWCIYSYIEIFYSRENKNIIKLYLAIVNALVFIGVISLFSIPFLEKVIYAMTCSIFVALVTSTGILIRRRYYFKI
ncbi:hypothetical protein GBO31_00155 [Aquimarina litoralis]|nr:hypothetical protein [Aquimarina litoralis]